MKLCLTFLLLFFVFLTVFEKATGKPTRKIARVSADKPIAKKGTNAEVKAKRSSLNSRINSSSYCPECAQLQIAQTTKKPSIIIADSICAFCQKYQDPIRSDCIKKHCSNA
uniref:Secreted protein n=1 Tax=Magallana gigas TaxID=29159 RepID=A0A8W8KV76_MAGGI